MRMPARAAGALRTPDVDYRHHQTIRDGVMTTLYIS
jgi:hypothetical protein